MDLNLQNWRSFRHLQDLIRFRDSGKTLDAGDDWLDKEIHDIMIDLGLKEQKKQSSGLGAGRLQALQNIQKYYITVRRLIKRGLAK
ncbi:hypothetical protein [Paenibacillus antibioticophila]|uniref:hypothetical protein n=1 Tax=Paenibacillus antibioticophila TaxID=1274374 RepID=UPI0005CB7CC0|nr:hypothetical protein [Paenibacillus antibioticophila]